MPALALKSSSKKPGKASPSAGQKRKAPSQKDAAAKAGPKLMIAEPKARSKRQEPKAVQSAAAVKKASSDTAAKSTDSKSEEGTGQSGKEISKAPTDPKKDPAFRAVTRHTKKVKASQEAHDSPDTKRDEIIMAAKLPVEQQEKMNDQLGHLDTLDTEREETEQREKRQPITATGFKAILGKKLDVLKDELPHNEASAKDFKKDKPISKIKESIAETVRTQNKKVTGTLAEEAGKKEPPKNEFPAEPVVAPKWIKEENAGKEPRPINSKAAAPKPKYDAEISMQKESQSLDDYMTDNAITETQLAKSNEPAFLGALNSKTEAQTVAAAAPQRYREVEKTKLDSAKNVAGKTGKKGFQGMFDKRGDVFNNIFGRQEKDKTAANQKNEAARKELERIYNQTKENVTNRLNSVSEEVNTLFNTEAEQAKRTFEKNIEKRLGEIYGWTRIDDEIKKVVGFSNDYDIKKVFETEKAIFINTMDKVLETIADKVVKELNEALKDIENGKKEQDKFFKKLDKGEQELLNSAFEEFNSRYSDLESTVYSKQEELAEDLAKSYKENVDSLRESFDRIKEEVSTSWIGAAKKALADVTDTVRKLKDLLFDILASATEAIEAIIADPVGFIANLFSGIKLGFINFKENIREHLLAGFITWLTGSLNGLGITIPEDLFSVKGIFNLIAQVLGLTWDYFRSKAVKLLGEKTVMVIEKGVELFRIVREKGMQGLWEHIKEQFNDLKETVIGAIKEMVISKVINAGIKWVMGLLSPVGAFIKAVMLIKDIAVFFVEKATQIAELVRAFIESVKAVASGNVTGVAKVIEDALAKAIPILIGFLASLIGINDLTARVQKIIKKIKERIDRAIDKLINKVRKTFKNLVKKGKAGAEKITAWWKAKKEFRTKKGEKHELYFNGSGNSLKAMVASHDPEELKVRLAGWMKEAKRQDAPQEKKDAKTLIKETEDLRKSYENAAKKQEKDDFSKQITNNLAKLFNTFDVEEGAEVKSGDTKVKSKVSWKTMVLKIDKKSDVVGVEMTADYLAPEHIRGSVPKDNTQAGIFSLLPTPEKGVDANKAYIKGHLLNDNLGGPGEEKNLFPITGQANSDHKNNIENTLREVVNDKKLLIHYHVKVDGIDIGPTGSYRVNSKFICTAHTYKMPPQGTAATSLPKSDKEWKVTVHSVYKGKVVPTSDGTLETDDKKAKSDYKGEVLLSPNHSRDDKAKKAVEDIEKQWESLKNKVKQSTNQLEKTKASGEPLIKRDEKDIEERQKKLNEGNKQLSKDKIENDKAIIENRKAEIAARENNKKEGENLMKQVSAKLEEARKLKDENKPENLSKIEAIQREIENIVSGYKPTLSRN